MPEPTSVEMIRALVGFDTTSRDSNLALIDFVRERLDRHGVASRLIHDETGTKANLYATIGPDDRPGVMLSGHTDVVPVDGQDWSSDPFAVVERDGKLFGRGTADMKSFIAVALALLPELVARRLRTPIHLAFSYDEEIGCIGVRRLIEALKGLPVRPAMCIVGEPTGMEVVIAHKGKKSLRAHVRGRACHSALAPEGVNAIEHAADLIAHLRGIGRRLAREGPFDTGFEVPYTTVQTGTVSGGIALNIVPQDCWFDFEFRHLPQDDPEALFAELKAYAEETVVPAMHAVDPATSVSWQELSQFPALDTREDAEVVAFVKALAGRNDHAKVAFGTEAGLFSTQAEVPAVVCGPGHIAQAHTPDEFIALDQVAQCEAFLRRLVDRLAA